MVAEAVVNQLAGPKTGGMDGTRHAPVVFGTPFGFVNRTWAGKNAGHGGAIAQRAEAAKHVAPRAAAGLLARQQFVLAGNGQLGQRRATAHLGRVHTLQDLPKSRRGVLGAGHHARQGGQQGSFTRCGVTRFQRIKV